MSQAPGATPRRFRDRLRARELMVGSFIKTPTTHSVEILGGLGFDFTVLDEEHAPWDRVSMDMALLAARAVGTAGVVRVSEPTAPKILGALDDGAVGVLVPHVYSAEKARDLAQAFRYRGGRRGFSNTTRAGGFGARSMWDHVEQGDAEATFIAMIEDPEALDQLDAIFAVDGLDAAFIGRGDLSVALGAPGIDAPEILEACERITTAARAADKPVIVMVGSAAEAERFQAMGASAFIVASDHGFMRQAASKALESFAPLRAG